MTNFLVFGNILHISYLLNCVFFKIVVTSHCDNNMLNNSIGTHIIYI